ncbi:MAG: cobalt transporter CbiM, partial [Bacteroidetes bacterium]|nr:cobalt transporter CbiM [Bacteroidota bacterium]
IPYLGMAAAFVFIIMMFNVPIPGGTTGHATGAALIALLLGPWTAVVSVSVALIIQALMFGDGGITAIGANCINMGVVMPFVAWYVFKLFNGKSEKSGRMWMAAFFAGYISLTVAALITAIQFGIQPLIEVSPEGLPLYAPYPLKIAIPAMAIEHLVLFSIVEGVVTALIFRYFYHNKPEMVTAMRNVKKQSSI